MTINPLVRYMLLCEDWYSDPRAANRVTIVGLISNLRATDDPPFPILYEELCVFLALTNGRGRGSAKIVCTYEATGRCVFETPSRSIDFGLDPLEIVGVPFRIQEMLFERAGLYSIQFWFDNELLAERPLLWR